MATIQGVSAQGEAQSAVVCLSCQRRKIKCDRQYPCSNCIKANTVCTPKPLPPPRKKRGPNPGLLAKLVHCEKLLEECANRGPERFHLDPSSQTSAPARIVHGSSSAQPTGKLVFEDGVVNFTQSPQWAALQEELRAMREIVELHSPSLNLFTNGLGSTEAGSCLGNDHNWQPSGRQGFRLWQVFLNRVHPVTKIIHAPSIQPYAAQAAYGFSGIPQNMKCLLFSIYNVTVFSLTDRECTEIMNLPKKKISWFCAQALQKHLRSTDFLRISSTKLGFNYYHEDLFDESNRSNKDLAATVVAAWEMRRLDLSTRLGYLPDVPDYIQQLQAMVTNATMASLASIDLCDLGLVGQDTLGFTWDNLGI